MMPSDFLEQIQCGEFTIWWDPQTGRGFRVRDDADPRGISLRLKRLRIGEDLSRWIVHRSARVLVLAEEGLWVPCPAHRTSGGYPYRLMTADLQLFAAINNSRTVQQLADHLHRPISAILATLKTLGAFNTQAIQIWPARVPHHRLLHIEGPPRPKHTRTVDQYGTSGQTTLGVYHHQLQDAGRQFDDHETTVAHALALPHPGLGGERFGARLRRVLTERGFPTMGETVEVGCGTGEFAQAWGADTSYLRVDLSPGLLRAQQKRVPNSPGVLGDALDLPLPSSSVDLLLSNEVLADLPSTPSKSGWENSGAKLFIREIERVLRPGGKAYLSEFGILSGPTEEAVQLDHPEVSIHFPALAEVARGLHLQVELIRLDELLNVDLRAEQLSRPSWIALRALAHSKGHHLEARAWTSKNLQLPWKIEGLRFTTLADEGPGPLITRFWVLLLEKD